MNRNRRRYNRRRMLRRSQRREGKQMRMWRVREWKRLWADRAGRAIANLMPAWIARWVLVRAAVKACGPSECPDSVTYPQMYKALEG